MKKQTIIIITLMLLLTASALASFTDEWAEFQDDEGNTGFVSDERARFLNGVNSTITIADGTDENQVLVVDLDNDGSNEIIINDAPGGLVKIFNNNYVIQSEIVLTASSPLTITQYLGVNYLLIPDMTSVKVYNYNSSGANLLRNISISGGVINGSGIKCIQEFSGYNDICAFLAPDDSVCPFSFLGNTSTCIATVSSTSHYETRFPSIGDVDNDNQPDLVAVYPGGSGDAILVYDFVEGGLNANFNPGGVTPGTVALPSCLTRNDTSSPMIYNIDGGSYPEIIVGSAGFSGNTAAHCIHAITITGNLFFPNVAYTTTTGVGTLTSVNTRSVAMCDFFGSDPRSERVMCLLNQASRTSGGDEVVVSCRYNNGTSAVSFRDSTITSFAGFGIKTGLVCADVNNDGVDEMITSIGVFNHTPSLDVLNDAIPLFSFPSENVNDIPSFADVNNDGETDIIMSRDSSTRIFMSGATNEPPVLYTNLTYAGFGSTRGFTGFICLNSTVTYSADQDVNYVNDDADDRERIVSNCGMDAEGSPIDETDLSLLNGSYSFGNPSFSCFFNQTGSYGIRLYLQDEFNTDDFTQFNTPLIDVNVIDGVEGVTCNVAESVAPGESGVTPTVPDTAQVDSDIDTTLGILFGTSTKLKLIIGLLIVIGLIVAVSQRTMSPFALSLTGVIGVALVTVIGFLPAYILILVLLIILSVGIASKFILGGSNGGG